jgi:hypothetical protein
MCSKRSLDYRSGEHGAPSFGIGALRQQRLGLDVGRVGYRGAALETARDRTQAVGPSEHAVAEVA